MCTAAATTSRTSSALARRCHQESGRVIEALDHLAVAGSATVYETLLGRRVVDGRLQTANVGLTFEGEDKEPLSALAFVTASLDKAARLLERRGVATTKSATIELSVTSTHGV